MFKTWHYIIIKWCRKNTTPNKLTSREIRERKGIQINKQMNINIKEKQFTCNTYNRINLKSGLHLTFYLTNLVRSTLRVHQILDWISRYSKEVDTYRRNNIKNKHQTECHSKLSILFIPNWKKNLLNPELKSTDNMLIMKDDTVLSHSDLHLSSSHNIHILSQPTKTSLLSSKISVTL